MKSAPSLALLLASFSAAQTASTSPAPAKTIDELIAQLANGELRDRAKVQLCRIGAPAVPALAQAFTSGWSDAHAATRSIARDEVLEILTELGPRAVGALDMLVLALEDPELESQRPGVSRAIAFIVPWAPAKGAEIERRLADMRGARPAPQRLRFDARQGVRELVEQAHGPNLMVTIWVCEALGLRAAELQTDPRTRNLVVQTLCDALGDMRALRTASGQGDPLAPEECVQPSIELALARVDPDHPAALHGLIHRLQRLDPRESAQAARALGRRGKSAVPAVAALLQALRTPDHEVQCEVITALGMIDAPQDRVGYELGKLAESEDKEIAQRAKAALRQLESEGK